MDFIQLNTMAVVEDCAKTLEKFAKSREKSYPRESGLVRGLAAMLRDRYFEREVELIKIEKMNTQILSVKFKFKSGKDLK